MWQNHEARTILLIVFCGGSAYGFLPISDYLIWDGWIQLHWLLYDWERYVDHYRSQGHGLGILTHAPLRMLGGPGTVLFAYKLIALLGVLANGVCFYLILRQSGRFDRDSAFYISVLAMLYPGYRVVGDPGTHLYQVCYSLSVLGFWALVRDVSPSRRWLARGFALLLLFYGLHLNSLLVYLPVAVMLWAFITGEPTPGAAFIPGLITRGLRSASRYIDVLLLAPVFWVVKQIAFPRSGANADYNQISISLERIKAGFATLGTEVLVVRITEPLALLSSALFILVAILLYFLVTRFPLRAVETTEADDDEKREVSGATMVAGGVVLLLGAALPYIVASHPFYADGWGSKNNILMGLPLALILFGFLKMLFREYRAYPVLLHAWLVLILLGSGVIVFQDIAGFQWNGIRELALRQKVHDLDPEYRYPILALKLNEGSEKNVVDAAYPPSVLSYQMAQPGPLRRLVVSGAPERPLVDSEIDRVLVQTTIPHAFQAIAITDAQARIEHTWRYAGSDLLLVVRYYYFKLLKPALLARFYDELISVDIRPVR